MEPVQYLRILRRRLRLILALTVLGALLGVASTLGADEAKAPQRQLYLATHILIDESTGDAPVNLGLAQMVATSGEVPQRVADQLASDPLTLVDSVHVASNPTVRTLQLSAVTDDAALAESIANTFAAELATYLIERDQAERDTLVANRQEQVDRLQAEFVALSETSAGLPEDEQELNQAQQRAVAAEITEIEQEIDRLEAAPLASEQLTTLQGASAQPVERSELANLLADPNPRRGGNRDQQSSGVLPGILNPTRTTNQTPAGGAADHPAARAGIGGILGFMAGIGLVLLIQRFDPRLRTKEDVEEAFGLPVVAEMPNLPRREQQRAGLLTLEAPRSPTAEAYRALRSSLVFADSENTPRNPPAGSPGGGAHFGTDGHESAAPEGKAERPARVVMVTSPGPSEGKTTSSANLAVVLAEAGYSVLAVNCDFRKPRLHLFLRAQEIPRRVLETAAPGVRMVTDVVADSSRANPAEIVAAQRHLVQQARSRFDIIVLDTAPLLTTNDAVDLLPEVDLVVVACRAGRTTRETAQRTAEVLRRHHAPMAGCVLVGATDSPSARYYYYYGDQRSEGARGGIPAREAVPTGGNGTTSEPKGKGTHSSDGAGGSEDGSAGNSASGGASTSPISLTTRPGERRR